MNKKAKSLLIGVGASLMLATTPVVAMDDPFDNNGIDAFFDRMDRLFEAAFNQSHFSGPTFPKRTGKMKQQGFIISSHIKNGVGKMEIQDLNTGEKKIIPIVSNKVTPRSTPRIQNDDETTPDEMDTIGKGTNLEEGDSTGEDNDPSEVGNLEANEGMMYGGPRFMPFGMTQMGQAEAETSRFRPCKPEKISMDKDIIGQTAAKKRLRAYIAALKNPAALKKLGGKMAGGVLLSGDPGNGKTFLAKAVANEVGVPFFSVAGSEFNCKYVGEGAKNIRDCFAAVRKAARKAGGAVLFIDEADAVGGSRSVDSNNKENDHTLNQLLVEMDGAKDKKNGLLSEGILVMAATNRPEILDAALVRSGRFGKPVEIVAPTKEERTIAFMRLFEKYKLDDSLKQKPTKLKVLAKKLASLTFGCSYADLNNILNEASIAAMANSEESISEKRIMKALDELVVGLESDQKRSPEETERTAVHEIGHAVAALACDQKVVKVTVKSQGNTDGVMMGDGKHDYTSRYSENELKEKIVVCLGGCIAEEIFYGTVTGGAKADLDQARNIAGMAARGGMGKRKRFQAYPKNRKVSQVEQKKYDADEEDILAEAITKTKTLLGKNKDLINNLKKELVQKETLEKNDIKKIVKQVGLVKD